MKIAITGVTGFRNRGVEALVQPIVRHLGERYPACRVLVHSASPEYDRGRPKSGSFEVLPEGGRAPVRGRIARRLGRLGVPLGKGAYRGWGELESSDLLLVTGGDVFTSDYGDASFEAHIVPIRVAIQNSVPFVIFAQSIGPFSSSKHRDWFMEVAPSAHGISVREERTHTYLTKELGLPAEKVCAVADPAFLLDPDPRGRAYADGCLRQGRPLVAISISQAIGDWTGVDRDARLGVWSELVRRMIERWGVSVVLVPHVQEPYANDAIACTDVWRRLGFHDSVSVLGADFSAAEYKGVISGCEFVVAERMHAGIAGLSSQVCTALVAYSAKARGIMDRMVGPECAAQGGLIEGALFRDPDAVWKRLEWAWGERAAMAAKLAASVPAEKLEARRAFDLLPSPAV